MKKALYVYNFRSGHQMNINRHMYVFEYLKKGGIELDEFIFDEDDEKIRLKLQTRLFETTYDLIIVYGGDGTLNSVVNVKLKNNFSIPIGLIPGGTCNDFAGGIGLENNVKKCLDIIIAGKIDFFDVGLINENRYFVGTCSGGNFVSVSYKTKREVKKLIGKAAYYFKAMIKALTLKRFKLKITKGDQVIVNSKVIIFIIMNGHQAAGFKRIKKDALMNDGRMDVIVIKECSLLVLPLLFLKAMFGRLEDDKRLISFKFDECKVEIQDKADIEIDGEEYNKSSMHIKIISNLLNVYVL